MNADGIGFDNEAALALAHRDEAVFLLEPTEQKAQEKSDGCTCHTNHSALEHKDVANLLVCGSHTAERLYITLLLDHQHRQGAYDIKASHQ